MHPVLQAIDEQLASPDLGKTEARSIYSIYGRMLEGIERKKKRRRSGRKRKRKPKA